MKKLLLLTLSVIAGIILISIPGVLAQSDTAVIPVWIKGVANFWVEGEINDVVFIDALEFLIESNIIEIRNPIYMTMPEESAQVQNLQERIDNYEIEKGMFESQINQLEEEMHTMESNEIVQEAIDNLAKMRDRSADFEQRLIQLQIKYNQLQAKYDKLK